MFRIDPAQFSKENTMLFSEGRWFIFLDHGDFASTKNKNVYPRLAHRCKKKDREKYMEPRAWSKLHSCCLVIKDNEVCLDCHEPIPKVFQGFFNLAQWSFE